VDAVPTLTVSMPARDAEAFIGQAIASVLGQTEVEFELIVVDDGSTDGTAGVVESFNDPRIRLIRNSISRGIAACHNLVIEQSRSPYIAHVDADDIILPGALAALVAKLESDPRLGQVHCFYFDVDRAGEAIRDACRKRLRALLQLYKPGFDYRRQLMVHGMVANCLRTYRREVFTEVGRFNESLRFGVDFEMALRLVDRFEIAVVPKVFYCRRLHGASITAPLRVRPLRSWLRRCLLVRRLQRSGEVRFLHRPEYGVHRAMLVGLGHALGLQRGRHLARQWLYARGGARGVVAQAIRPAAERLYYTAVERLSWWPLEWLRRARPVGIASGRRIGFYLWRFPVLSETFICREMAALVAQGFEVRVFADAPADLAFVDTEARSLLVSTEFLTPADPGTLAAHRRFFFRRNPIVYLNVMLYVLFHRYDYWKTLNEDRTVFRQAVYLAGAMKDAGVTHVHSPWANRCAFVAIVAARLLGVPSSVQARAHDLHRRAQRYALPEKFQSSDFVVTNCHYNEAFIRSVAPALPRCRLHTIYEGLDLTRFKPRRNSWSITPPVRILSVARLVEEKGLEHLLQACARLRERGMVFQCEIIGGAEVPLYADYLLRLQKVHRALALEECVRFRGAQPFRKVLKAYERADVFVLPCVVASNGGRDITPNSLIEAMAMQLPVVSTRLAAIPEIVDDGVSGMLVPPHDPEALCAAVEAIVADAALGERLGRNARRRVEERFNLATNSARFAEVFRGTRS
jgi:glycosyltransferase involved in cell wall biosynthesis